MSQNAMQEVPTTPQLGALLVQEDDGFNQRVPSQEFYLQDDDDFSLVPRTPNTRLARELQRTPVMTPVSRQRSAPGSGTFPRENFRTPTMHNAPLSRQISSPAAQVVPGTPDCPGPRRCLRTASPAVPSPLVAAALKTPTQTDWTTRSPLSPSPGISKCDASTSPFIHPGITETPEYRQQKGNIKTPGLVTPTRPDLRKRVLSRSHSKLAPEKLYFDSDGGCNKKMTDRAANRTECVTKGDTLALLHGVVHRLQEDDKQPNTCTEQNHNGIEENIQTENSNVPCQNEDLLDIIDKTD